MPKWGLTVVPKCPESCFSYHLGLMISYSECPFLSLFSPLSAVNTVIGSILVSPLFKFLKLVRLIFQTLLWSMKACCAGDSGSERQIRGTASFLSRSSQNRRDSHITEWLHLQVRSTVHNRNMDTGYSSLEDSRVREGQAIQSSPKNVCTWVFVNH